MKKRKIPRWLSRAAALVGILAVLVSSLILPASADDAGGGVLNVTLDSLYGLSEMQFYNSTYNYTVATPLSVYPLVGNSTYNSGDKFSIYIHNGKYDEIPFRHYIDQYHYYDVLGIDVAFDTIPVDDYFDSKLSNGLMVRYSNYVNVVGQNHFPDKAALLIGTQNNYPNYSVYYIVKALVPVEREIHNGDKVKTLEYVEVSKKFTLRSRYVDLTPDLKLLIDGMMDGEPAYIYESVCYIYPNSSDHILKVQEFIFNLKKSTVEPDITIEDVYYGAIKPVDINTDFVLSDFLINSVGGFLDFEIYPGLSLSGIFICVVSILLIVAFLKVFAGG